MKIWPVQVVFYSYASDLVAGDTNGKEDVYTYDTCCNKFTRVSKPDEELPDPVANQDPSAQAVISGDGRRVAFISRANNLMGFDPEPNAFDNIYSYDVQTQQRRRYSRNTVGLQSNGHSARPVLNYGGNMMLFDSIAVTNRFSVVMSAETGPCTPFIAPFSACRMTAFTDREKPSYSCCMSVSIFTRLCISLSEDCAARRSFCACSAFRRQVSA